MEDSDVEDLTKETLHEQYLIVKKKTNLSHVMQYGNLSIESEIVANFQGHKKSRLAPIHQLHDLQMQNNIVRGSAKWESREIPLKTLESQLKHTTDLAKRVKLSSRLTMMKKARRYHDEHTRKLISKLTLKAADHQEVMTRKPGAIKAVACHHNVVKAYSRECFNLGQNSYALNAVAPLTNLCERGVAAERIVETIKSHCAGKNHRAMKIN